MDTNSHRAEKNLKAFSISVAPFFLLVGCAGIQQDPSREPNLARSPIGVHVQKVGTGAGMAYADITVRNNSGKFINTLYIEVLVYDNENRVGMTNHIFNSVNVGETMVTQNPINSGGRPWSSWRYTYRIH
jgi:hypothetical protein